MQSFKEDYNLGKPLPAPFIDPSYTDKVCSNPSVHNDALFFFGNREASEKNNNAGFRCNLCFFLSSSVERNSFAAGAGQKPSKEEGVVLKENKTVTLVETCKNVGI